MPWAVQPKSGNPPAQHDGFPAILRGKPPVSIRKRVPQNSSLLKENEARRGIVSGAWLFACTPAPLTGGQAALSPMTNQSVGGLDGRLSEAGDGRGDLEVGVNHRRPLGGRQ